MSALMQACQTGNLDVAAKLLSYECDVNATDAVSMVGLKY